MLNILIIDAKPEDVKSVFAESSRSNYNITTSSNVEDGLELAQDVMPDVILLDQYLGSRFDYDFVLTLRSNPLTGQIPILFLADDNSKESVVEAMAQGIRGYLVRPVSKDYLLEKIQQVNEMNERHKAQHKNKIKGSVLYRKEEELHVLYFLGRLQQNVITDFFRLYSANLKPLPEETGIALDIRHLISPEENEISLFRAALNSMQKHTPRVVAGKNYVQCMPLELDMTSQLFMNKQDFTRYWALRKEGAIDF